MSFDWLQYINVATYLQANLPTEASYRSGVSRAYYSVFGIARLFCVNNGILKQSELKAHDIHQRLIANLKQSDDEELFKIGARIDALKIRRQEADYDPFVKNINSRLLLDTIEKANELIELMDAYE